MADIKHDGKAIAVSTNKLERHHWRMGLAACTQVSSSAFRLAAVIEDHMNDRSGEAWPEQETLSRRAAMSARQIREHLTALAAAGWLTVLSGKNRTRPKTRRGLHYLPTWPDLATKERCLKREYAATVETFNTGGKPPVSNRDETGNPASQKRKSGASIPADQRRNTGGNPPLSYEATYETTHTGRGSSRAPRVENSSVIREAAFADASGSLIGDEREDTFTADEAHSFFAEAFEALCASGDDPSFASPDKTSDTDEQRSSADQTRAADAAASDEKRVRWMIDLCAERDDDLSMKDSVFIARLEGRDASSFTPDDIRRLANIVNALPEQEKSGVYFGDDADEEAHAGVPF